MSQNMINELTDRVSALTAEKSLLEAHVLGLERTLAAKTAASAEVVQTAEGLLGETKRLKAEVRDLSVALLEAVEAARLFNRGGMTWLEYDRKLAHFEQVEEIKIEARNNID